MRLEGKVAIITGAAQGHGQAAAELFASEGAIVYGADLRAADGDVAVVQRRQLDIGEESHWTVLVEEVLAAHGRVDILVNNAGITGTSGPFADTSLEDWSQVLQTNLTGTFLGMKAVIPGMQERRSGAIVNIASIVALSPVPFVAPYHASKGGIRVLTKHAAMSYAAAGIRVNAVFPGIIDTPMMDAAASIDGMPAAFTGSIPMGRIGTPREVAYATLFLASDEASYLTGVELVVDGGASVHSALAAAQMAVFVPDPIAAAE